MGVQVTGEERKLIEELLQSHKPDVVAQLVGRGRRTVYYIAAEMNRRSIEKQHKPLFHRLINRLLKGDKYETKDTTGIRTYRRP